jgi:hypothetical protein
MDTRGRVSVWEVVPRVHRTRAPPCGDTRDGQGCRVNVVEVRGSADDLVARDDDVCGKGPDGRVCPTTEEAEPTDSVISCVFDCDALQCDVFPRERRLRGFGGERIILPTAGWDEEDTVVQ